MRHNDSHYSQILTNKINQAIHLNDLILTKTQSLTRKPRNRRAIIDGIGKLSKWLFGTLDSDDEKYYYNYLETLNKNTQELKNNAIKQQSLLREITTKYHENFEILSDNQNLLKTQITNLKTNFKQVVHSEQALSLSVTIDNLIIQLNIIRDLINNIETAVSFAKLNILHISIIEPNVLENIISNLRETYSNDQIPSLKNVMNYYHLFSTQTIVKDNLIIFKIHIPILSKSYKLFQMYPVPIQNKTIFPQQPFLLFNQEDYWTTDEECPEIENYFYCQTTNLHKGQPCLLKIIQAGINDCSSTAIHISESYVTQINSHQILAIPVEPITAQTSCKANGIYHISKPSIISLENCEVTINNKVFRPENSLHDDLVFDLPKLEVNMPKETPVQPPLRLKTIDFKKLNHIDDMIRNLKEPQLYDTDKGHP
jgi:Baculovirus F protein